MNSIKIVGARQHNLKNISLEIPRDKLVVVTGLSGSGKSSLAFDTIYAEGQRRYVESLSAYARQFLELMPKPDVDRIEGLSPAISIEQRNPSRNPRSTVATVTEIYDYLRLLYARVGTQHCPRCGTRVQAWSPQQIVSELFAKSDGKRVRILAPLVIGRIGTYEDLFSRLGRDGFVKVRLDGEIKELGKIPPLKRYIKHTIDLLVDEFTVSPEDRERITESVETALGQSRGLLLVQEPGKGDPRGTLYSEKRACPRCGSGFQEMEPRLFSFNSPHGACPSCGGLGVKTEVSPDLVIPDPSLSVHDGAVSAWSNPVTTRTHRWKNSWAGYYWEMLEQVCRRNSIPVDIPWKSLPRKHKNLILYGGGAYRVHWAKNESEYEGVINNLKRRYDETESEFVKEEIYRRFMREVTCPDCAGARLKPEALSVFVGGLSITALTRLSVQESVRFMSSLRWSPKELVICRQILKEINARLDFLISVGLGYLTMDRRSETLAGGEAQRIHLATQIGSGLTGVLYVLDEPTIGLHPRDNTKLLATLKALRDLGNTLIVVEHDEETIRSSDWIVDLGPGAGLRGGEIVFQGTIKNLLENKKSQTAAYLEGTKLIMPGRAARGPGRRFLTIKGARQFNLKNIDVKIPLGLFVCVSGVSGSGKSTLVHEIIYKGLAQKLYNSKELPGAHSGMEGDGDIDKVIIVDQSPIGRTPRSNPATYTGVFTPIRELFAELPEAKRRGYKAGRFSFNVKGGRCENCQGDGTLRIQMQFLPDVYVNCEQCAGRRFNEETLRVHFKGKSIADVLDMSAEEALSAFPAFPAIAKVLRTLVDVGLGYIKLGQSATTLSGGEAQRVKLAAELCRRATGRTLYILDEPTTGLHFADVEKLLAVLHRLVEQGNTVIVIEHNLDVVKTADWIIDLGPEGGDGGGEIVAQGPPGAVISQKRSHTGRYLSEILAGEAGHAALKNIFTWM